MIGTFRFDARGGDNNNLNDEWVEFTNPSSSAVDLTGWQIKDESASHRYGFPNGFTLVAGATVRLHTGCGSDTVPALYWCNTGSAVWNTGGDAVFVLDPGREHRRVRKLLMTRWDRCWARRSMWHPASTVATSAIGDSRFSPDPHRFDGDRDGIGCES